MAPRVRSVKDVASWKVRCSWLTLTSVITGAPPGRGLLIDSENCTAAHPG